MRKNKGIFLCLLMVLMLGIAGCGHKEGENIKAGFEAIGQSDYNGAIACFEQAVVSGEDLELSYRGYGLAYLGMADYDNAVLYFEKALDNGGIFAGDLERDINFYMATALYKNGEPEEAETLLDAIIESDKKNADAWYLRGSILIGEDDYEGGIYNFEKAMEYIVSIPDDPEYHTKMISLYENMINCKVLENDFTGIDAMLSEVEKEHLPYADAIDRLGILISKTFYMHRSGQYDKRDECINKIDSGIRPDMLFLDLLEDFFVYLNVLFESDKNDEFWHLVELMEPMLTNMKVTGMQVRLLSLKIRYYRKNHMNAEYLQSAGLYYELSEREAAE